MDINLRDVKFAYPDAPEKTVLDIDQWSVSEAERVFVQGASGGGKSTLLNLLSGMISSTQGEISVLGERLDKMNRRQRDQFRANHIGYVFQQFNLIPYLDALDNILLASHFSKLKNGVALREEGKTLLTTLNISPSDWNKPTRSLSIGQQQRVAIARALINKPELLIADEPTSSLDQHNRDNFMSILMSLIDEHNITLVLVSHDASLSTHFNRVEVLNDINQMEVNRCSSSSPRKV